MAFYILISNLILGWSPHKETQLITHPHPMTTLINQFGEMTIPLCNSIFIKLFT